MIAFSTDRRLLASPDPEPAPALDDPRRNTTPPTSSPWLDGTAPSVDRLRRHGEPLYETICGSCAGQAALELEMLATILDAIEHGFFLPSDLPTLRRIFPEWQGAVK